MGPLDLLLHLGGFLAPALAVALFVSLLARLLLPGLTANRAWSLSLVAGFLVGAAALAAGLVLFGRDGKMLSYAALVLACAGTEWAVSRGWR